MRKHLSILAIILVLIAIMAASAESYTWEAGGISFEIPEGMVRYDAG